MFHEDWTEMQENMRQIADSYAEIEEIESDWVCQQINAEIWNCDYCMFSFEHGILINLLE